MNEIIKDSISKLDTTSQSYIKNDGATVSFTIQNGPIKEFGLNGCQIIDIVEFAKNVIEHFNSAFPCRENALTITKLEEAIHWQEARTKDRLKRQVEGENKI